MPYKFVTAFFAAILLAFACGPVYAAQNRLPAPEIGDDGLHKQPWFVDSFLDLSEDLTEAKSKGKRLVLMWEQNGCPYCAKTHEVNLTIPKIVDFLKANFNVIQLNLWGDREVTDFDGEVLPEKDMARKWGIAFTPTIQFFPDDIKEVVGKNARDAELVRVPGYFKPFHFYFMFRYIQEKAYVEQPSFQRYLLAQGEKLRAKGVDTEKALWSDDLAVD